MSPPESGGTVTVVGSVNADLVLRCHRLPVPGESIAATGTQTHNGGKGANQAIALARLGIDVAFIGRVGNDNNGSRLRDALAAEGVDTTGLLTVDAPTGLAVILVDDLGDNMIVVDPGANVALAPDDLDHHARALESADVVLVQMEIPIDVVREVTERAGGIVILNPAPATPLDADALSGVDYLIPNRTELATLAGCPAPGTEADILAAIRSLAFDGTVIVTLGGDGAIATAGGEIVVRATPPDVPVVDTVGAGDAFCGGFAASIARGESLSTAIGFAVACGAHATTIRGAQPSMPSYGDAEALVASVAVDTIDTWNE